MSKSVNVDFVTRQIEVDTDGKEHFISAAMAAKDAEQSMLNAQNAATSVQKYKALWFDSVAAMKAEPSLTAGAYVCTAGYYEPNDGGGASYLIREKLESDIDDGGSLHELSNGLVAELIVENGTVNVKQFGAKGDGVTDDSNAFKTAIDKGMAVFIPTGIYHLETAVDTSNAKFIYGCGKNSVIQGSFTQTTHLDYQCIKGLLFRGSNKTKTALKGVFAFAKLEDLTFLDWDIAIEFEYGTWISRFLNINIAYCNTGIKTCNQFNSIELSCYIQHCGTAIDFVDQSRQVNIHDSDFEVNDIVFSFKDCYAFSLKNSYIERNNIIFKFNLEFYSGDWIVENNYFWATNGGGQDGWLITVPSSTTTGLQQTPFRLINNKFNIYGDNSLIKPIYITGTNSRTYLAISIEGNFWTMQKRPVFYSDLYKIENGETFVNTRALTVSSDLPIFKYSNLYFYEKIHQSLNGTNSYEMFLKGYVEIEKTGSSFIEIALGKNIGPGENQFVGICHVLYNDNTVDAVRFKMDDNHIYLYEVDKSKTTAKIVFDTSYRG